MGQRLVVAIKNNEKTFCTVYYHWSGYYKYAVSITAKTADAIAKTNDQKNIPVVQRAILHFVDQCGGGVRGTEEDIKAIYEIDPSYDVAKDYSRDYGLISITDQGIRSQLSWAEYLTEINVENNTCTLDSEEEVWPSDSDEEDWFLHGCDKPAYVYHHPPYDPRSCPIEHAMELYRFMQESTNRFYGKEVYVIDKEQDIHPYEKR